MSANAAVATAAIPARNGERAHRIRLVCGYVLLIALIVGVAVYGFDYYTLGSADRPFSPKHHVLRPSGAIGIKLGFMGLTMFLAIFVYPLRKKWLMAFAAGEFETLARHPRDARTDRALHHCPARFVQISRIRRHGFLDHGRGFTERGDRPVSVRSDSAPP